MQFELDDLVIDIQRQRVYRGNEALNVSGLSFRLLRFMLERGDTVVGFDDLISGVWAPSVVNEETVTQRVRLLRAALGDDGRQPRYVRSVRGRGYQLVPVPRMVSGPGGSENMPRRWSMGILAALAALGLVMAIWWMGAAKPPPDDSPASAGPGLLERAEYYAGIGQEADLGRAAELYQRAIADDPENTRARLGLSFVYSGQVCRYNDDLALALRAEALARKVLETMPEFHRAHEALGYAKDCQGLIDEAIASYTRAVSSAPVEVSSSRTSLAYLLARKGALADALSLNLAVRRDDPGQTFNDLQLARVYELLGYPAAAEVLYERSFVLYPDNVFSNAAYPRTLYLQGRFNDAREALESALKRPVHPEIGILDAELALLTGDSTRAAGAFQRAWETRPSNTYFETLYRIHGGNIHGRWIEKRLAALSELRADGVNPVDSWLEEAMLHQANGATKAAIDALHGAVDNGFRDRSYLQVSPLFAVLRDEPEFTGVIDRIGVAVKTERERVPPDQRPAAP